MKQRRTVAASLLLLVAGALAFAGCGMMGPAAVSSGEVETQVSDKLAELVGETPEDISCPQDLPAEEGAEMTCVLSNGGETIDVTVTVTSIEDNTVNFDIQVADAINE